MASKGTERSWAWVRWTGWGGAALLILAALAMPSTREAWTVGDYVFASLLIGGVGLALELAVRISPSWSYRAGAALGLAAGFFLLLANGAVGYIGSEDNPYNLVFFIVIAIAFAGALVSGFKAKGMAWTMLAAGIAHALAGFGGAAADPRTIPITIVFAGMWLGSARLFQLASRE